MIESIKKIILKKIFHIEVTERGDIVEFQKVNDKQIISELLGIINRQQEFISKNINERVVYVDPQSGYTNVERYDDPNAEKKEEEPETFEPPEDVTPEKLQEIMEGKEEDNSEEGEK